MLTHSTSCNLTQRCNLIFELGGCFAWDVSPVAPTPFGFLLLFFLFFLFFFLCVGVCVCVLYYKFILHITRGAPNKAVKKKIIKNNNISNK